MANFPGAVSTATGSLADIPTPTSTNRNVTPTLSERIHALRDEIIAIEATLGANPDVDPQGTDQGTVKARLNLVDGGFTAWTPAPSGCVLGTGGVAFGRYKQIGKQVTVLGGVKWGTGTNAASGTILVTLPVAASNAAVTAGLPSLTVGQYRLNAVGGILAGSSIEGTVDVYSGGTQICFFVPPFAAVGGELLTATNPISLGQTNDSLIFSCTYEAA